MTCSVLQIAGFCQVVKTDFAGLVARYVRFRLFDFPQIGDRDNYTHRALELAPNCLSKLKSPLDAMRRTRSNLN